ncbi:MAG TPA: cupredoxin domain-containing protein [bacterium]|nr:cupredoxin domain-containing protein [bacterium]
MRMFAASPVLFAGALCALFATAVYAVEPAGDFTFVQLSDIHWGFSGPTVNPDARGTLAKTIALVNSLNPQPDFIVCTGDLTHTTNDPAERRRRMTELREQLKALKVKDIRFLPGEHDAALDTGAAYKEIFGPTHYTFDHKGIHFIVLDNCSDPLGQLGDAQLRWLADDLKKQDTATARLVVFTHRPLFDLYPDWDWLTRDASKATDLLAPYKNVAVFYGHIHQENVHVDGNITQYAAPGLMYPLPAPGSQPKKAPMPWDSMQPYRGLGFRAVKVQSAPSGYVMTQYAADQMTPVVNITAKKFAFEPNQITLRSGTPAIIELTSLDRQHGFSCPGLGIRVDVNPGVITRVLVSPAKPGSYPFHCDVFCGEGHGDMMGTIIVK